MRKKEIYKPILIERPFTLNVYIQKGDEYDKAELILGKLEPHIQLFMREKRRLFDKFMEMDIVDLKDVFRKTK